MDESMLDALRQGLDRVERRLRRWRILAFIGWVLLIGGLVVNALLVRAISAQLAAQQEGASDTAEAEEEVLAKRFVLVDEDGRPRAALAIRPDGSPGLAFSDEAGKVIWKAP
jgi:hypothetical protein